MTILLLLAVCAVAVCALGLLAIVPPAAVALSGFLVIGWGAWLVTWDML